MKPILLISPEELDMYGLTMGPETIELALSITEDDWIKIFKTYFHTPLRTQDATIMAHVYALLGQQFTTWSEYGPAMRDEGFRPRPALCMSHRLNSLVAIMRRTAITDKIKEREHAKS